MSQAKEPTPDQLHAEIARRQAENAASFVKNAYKDEQRRVWALTVGMTVHDLVEFEDANGDDLIMTVFRPANLKDVQEGTKCVVQVLILEQRNVRVWFTEAFFKGGRLLDTAGANLIPKLQRSEYNIL